MENFKFQKPGAFHHARFMSKCNYYLKMALTSEYLDCLHQNEIREVHVMAEFVGVFYSRWWFHSALPSAAPADDLQAISLMQNYQLINPEVASPCLQSQSRHLWYLTD